MDYFFFLRPLSTRKHIVTHANSCTGGAAHAYFRFKHRYTYTYERSTQVQNMKSYLCVRRRPGNSSSMHKDVGDDGSPQHPILSFIVLSNVFFFIHLCLHVLSSIYTSLVGRFPSCFICSSWLQYPCQIFQAFFLL